MAMLRGSTYVCAVKFWGCDGVEVDGTRVVKAEFVVGGLDFLYVAGEENERVAYDAENNRFLLVLKESETLGFAGKSVRWQAKAMMVDGSVSGTLLKNEYLYDTLCLTVLNTEGVEVSTDSQGRILDAMLENVLGGGGGEGTTDYERLRNKPRINDVELVGNKTSSDLGLANASDIPTATSDLTNDGDGESPFATQAYVEQNGGKIDSISVNTVTQTIDENKNVDITVPTKISDLNNDSGFITNAVNDLTNYYLKSETYTQAEVNALIGGIATVNIQLVNELPTASASTYFGTSKTIYLLRNQTTSGSNYYDEYITIRSGEENSYTYSWECVGSTQIDLSGYVQKTTTIAGVDLQDNITTAELQSALSDSTHRFVSDADITKWNNSSARGIARL